MQRLWWLIPCQRSTSSSKAQLRPAANRVCPGLVAQGQSQPCICIQNLAEPTCFKCLFPMTGEYSILEKKIKERVLKKIIKILHSWIVKDSILAWYVASFGFLLTLCTEFYVVLQIFSLCKPNNFFHGLPAALCSGPTCRQEQGQLSRIYPFSTLHLPSALLWQLLHYF